MQRMIPLTLSVLLLFSLAACGAEETAERASSLRERYGDGLAYAAEAEVELCRAEENVRYTLRVEADGEETRVTVLAPALLEGITARLVGEALTLEYDGLLLDAGSAAEGLNAVNCVPLTLRAVGSGVLIEQNEEDFDEAGRAVRLCLESEASGAPLRYTVYFGDDGAPLYAEVAENEKIAVFMEFTSFRFCDKIAENGETAAE